MKRKKKANRNARRARAPARTGRRNAPAMVQRARASMARLNEREALQTVAIACAGGVAGAVGAGVAIGAGIEPQTAAIATLAGGAAGAYALRGNARVFAIGAACAASGQLAMAWQIRRRLKQAERERELVPPGRVTALPAPSTSGPMAAVPPKNSAPVGRNGWDEDDGADAWRNAWAVEPWDGEPDDEAPGNVDLIDVDAYELVED